MINASVPILWMKKQKPREGDLLEVTFLVENGTNVERDSSGIFFLLKLYCLLKK